MVPLFGAAYAAPYKGTTILYWFRPPKTVLNPRANGKIQGFFKAFECFSRQILFSRTFKRAMYIQVLSSLCEPCGVGRIIRKTCYIGKILHRN